MKKLLITTLLLMLLLPISAMSKGNDDAIAKHNQKQEKFLGMVCKLVQEGKQIPYVKAGERIQYLFKDDLIRLYLISIFLKHGENSLKVSTLLNHMFYVSRFEDKYPVVYEDILGNEHTFTKKEFIDQLKGLLISNDPNVKISSCRALVGLDYIDDEIFSLLKYYAIGTDMDSWDITNGARYINGITSALKTEWENPSKEKQVQCREDMQIASLYTLHKIRNEKYSNEVKELFNKLLSKNMSGRLKKRLQEYMKKFESKKDDSFNYFDNTKSSKLSEEYLAIWKPDSSKSYCEKYWGPDEAINYNHADYTDYTSMGGDCANFASQCLIAGGLSFSDAVVSTNPIAHPCGESTIVDCNNLNTFLTAERDDIKSLVIDFTTQIQAVQEDPHGQIPSWFRTGDIALLGVSDGDHWAHTIINHGGNGTDATFGCHSSPNINEVLDYTFWINYDAGVNDGLFDYITFYHVIGSTALVEPSKDILTVSLVDTLNLKAMVTNNTVPTSLNEITNFKFDLKKKPANTVETIYSTTSQPSVADSTYVFDFETATQDTGLYVLIAETTYAEGTTIDSCFLKIKAIPEIISPLIEDIHFLPPLAEKGAVTDTIKVQVQVPKILEIYPAIKLKIDGVYVDQGDIVFEDNLWVYYWDLVDVTSEITGKRFKIEAKLFDDPKCKDESGAMIVESIYAEDFEAFTGIGWNVHFYENPNIAYNGWFLYTDPLDSENTTLTSMTQNSMSLQYQIWTPPFIVPDSSDFETILDYSVYYDKTDDSNHGNLYFWVTDENDDLLTDRVSLFPVDGEWSRFNYDLSEFYGQTIRFRWEQNYWSSTVPCMNTTFALDSILVYVTPPDMDLPIIDYITGNQANVNEDMNINLAFNDASGIVSVTADYNIEGESGIITLSPSKDAYNYTGIISARDHVCDGDIKFRVEDEIGNTIISDSYEIYWTESGGTQAPSIPSNLIITAENDSTVALTWSIVAGASEYKVYASEDPYGTFILDTLGTFISGTHWQKNINTNKMFYRITAGNTSKVFSLENNIKPEKVDIERNLRFIDPRNKRK